MCTFTINIYISVRTVAMPAPLEFTGPQVPAGAKTGCSCFAGLRSLRRWTTAELSMTGEGEWVNHCCRRPLTFLGVDLASGPQRRSARVGSLTDQSQKAMHGGVHREPVWPSGKALGRSTEGPRLDSASSVCCCCC